MEDTFTGPVLAERLKGKKTPIKSALLDQRVVAGVGNIYACEALYAARISPRRGAFTVQGERAARLASAVRTVLKRAIDAGGSSLRDHVAPSGELGYFQHSFSVYGREGEPCPDCDCGGLSNELCRQEDLRFYAQNASDKEFFFASFTRNLGVFDFGVFAQPALAQPFFNAVEDLPLAPGLVQTLDQDIFFESLSGRIVTVFARGGDGVTVYQEFYKKALTPLGWALQADGTYSRDNEVLKIDLQGPWSTHGSANTGGSNEGEKGP